MKNMNIPPAEEFNWTAFGVVFTACATILGGFWAWLTHYYSDQAKQREAEFKDRERQRELEVQQTKDFLKAVAGEVVKGELVNSEKRINEIANDVKELRKMFHDFIASIDQKILDLYKDKNK